ncbi:hypothetical protein G3I40_12115, partial [Streptomyces sp. SID14478]|nr:hypothetical protein [Streptomyces sp. SID14478]
MLLIAALLAWLVSECAARRRERVVRRRVRLVLAVAAGRPGRRSFEVPGAVRRWAPVAGAVSAGYVLAGGVAGLALGAVEGMAVWRWLRERGEHGGAGPD